MPPIGSFQNIEQGLDFLQLIFGHRVFTGEVELGLELFPDYHPSPAGRIAEGRGSSSDYC